MEVKVSSAGSARAAVAPVEAARALRNREGFVFLDSSLAGTESRSFLASEPDQILEGDGSDWGQMEEALAARTRRANAADPPDGAAIGWIGFDGRFRFGFYDQVHVYHHASGTWQNPPPLPPSPAPPDPPRITFRPLTPRADFLRMVERAQEAIAAGDIYQVCLAHRLEAEFVGDAWPYYEALRRHSPAPQAAFLDLGGTQIASASPECFLHLSGRQIRTRPIKGTRPRRADPGGDRRSASALLTSPKEMAELIMITDLERNDLGQVCEFGSISVPELLKLESYEQVHHLVSTVQGTLRKNVTHPAAVRACFPGGSISGAPKKRALEIIAELEPEPRGIYTGAIGYFGDNGESQFNIAIRTATFEAGIASAHVGAGIVADSIAANEWQETLDKAAGLLQAASADASHPPSLRQ